MHLGRYMALAALIVAGVCAALPFAKTPAAGVQAQAAPVESAAARLALPRIAVETDGQAVSPVPDSEVTPASWHQPTPIVLPPDGEPLPILPETPVVRATTRDAASRIYEPDFTAPLDSPKATPPARQATRKHRIVDGDSLPLIALRYLGDQERASEIAELNRDVINDLRLLPVGREIVIPVLEQD